MATGRALNVLVAAVVVGAAGLWGCGTILGINPDTSAPPTGDGADGGRGDAPIRATGGSCVFDDAGSKFDDVCGFGP